MAVVLIATTEVESRSKNRQGRKKGRENCKSTYVQFTLQARSRNCEKRQLASSSVRTSVRMEQLSFHWTGFHENLYLSIFETLSIKFKSH